MRVCDYYILLMFIKKECSGCSGRLMKYQL